MPLFAYYFEKYTFNNIITVRMLSNMVALFPFVYNQGYIRNADSLESVKPQDHTTMYFLENMPILSTR